MGGIVWEQSSQPFQRGYMMRKMIPATCLMVALVTFLLVSPAHGQEEGNNGVYGYTSLDYDPSTKELTGYSETDEDGSLQVDYRPHVSATLTDQNNKVLGSASQSGYSSASVTIYATGATGVTYTMAGSHFLVLDQMVQQGGLSEYQDWAGMNQYQSFGFDEPFMDTYTGFVYPDDQTLSPDIILGGTYDVARYTTPLLCGDVRDQIVQEYYLYLVALTPTCSTFSNSIGPDPYTIWTLIPDETASYKPWAIIQAYLPPNLNLVQSQISQTLSISSGYRNPAAEYAAAQANGVKPAHNSRHMYGDAVDIRASNNSGYWSQLRTAGHTAKACVEPSNISTYSHAHLDWRKYYGATAGCPPNW
jgi:hypothetical protein